MNGFSLISAANFPDVGVAIFEGKTVFIGGGDSDYIPVADHDEIRETFPGSAFEYVEGAGHWVHSQKPKEFLQVLQRFLEE